MCLYEGTNGFLLLLLPAIFMGTMSEAIARKPLKPNIVVIMADDLVS